MERWADINTSLWIWTITVQIISQNLSCVCKTTLSANGKKENGLFNDALITFYLECRVLDIWLRTIQTERRIPLPSLHDELLNLISSQGYFICTIPQTEQYTRWHLLYQLWCTGWNEKSNEISVRGKRKSISYQVWCLLFWVAVAC